MCLLIVEKTLKNHKNNKDLFNSLPLTSPPDEEETTQEENKDL